MTRSEHGGVTVLMTVAVLFAAMVLLQVARAGVAASRAAQADTAADAAALAATHALARHEGMGAAITAARVAAAENGAQFVACDCLPASAEVTVAIGSARGRARAELRIVCGFEGCPD